MKQPLLGGRRGEAHRSPQRLARSQHREACIDTLALQVHRIRRAGVWFVTHDGAMVGGKKHPFSERAVSLDDDLHTRFWIGEVTATPSILLRLNSRPYIVLVAVSDRHPRPEIVVTSHWLPLTRRDAVFAQRPIGLAREIDQTLRSVT